jgi:hypothetical protein
MANTKGRLLEESSVAELFGVNVLAKNFTVEDSPEHQSNIFVLTLLSFYVENIYSNSRSA